MDFSIADTAVSLSIDLRDVPPGDVGRFLGGQGVSAKAVRTFFEYVGSRNGYLMSVSFRTPKPDERERARS